MTNTELKELLEKALEEDSIDQNTLFLLQDASIHAALKLGVPLEAASVTYDILLAGHAFFTALKGIAEVSNMELFKDTKKAEVPKEEADMLSKLLGDINLDLS